MDGRLYSGDEIVAVDGQSVMGASHHVVVGMMGSAAQRAQVQLTVRRRAYQGEPKCYGRGNCAFYCKIAEPIQFNSVKEVGSCSGQYKKFRKEPNQFGSGSEIIVSHLSFIGVCTYYPAVLWIRIRWIRIRMQNLSES